MKLLTLSRLQGHDENTPHCRGIDKTKLARYHQCSNSIDTSTGYHSFPSCGIKRSQVRRRRRRRLLQKEFLNPKQDYCWHSTISRSDTSWIKHRIHEQVLRFVFPVRHVRKRCICCVCDSWSRPTPHSSCIVLISCGIPCEAVSV